MPGCEIEGHQDDLVQGCNQCKIMQINSLELSKIYSVLGLVLIVLISAKSRTFEIYYFNESC